MEDEIGQMIKMQVWKLEPLPPGKRPLTCRWVYRRKLKSDNAIDKYRARLCVRGNAQTPGEEFRELFAPVARADTIRTLLAIGAARKLKVKQFDISVAFLHGELEEVIWMTQPPGFQDNTGRVCKLLHSLYGLRQASRCFNRKFAALLRELNFSQSQADNCLYYWHGPNGEMTLIALYVDDGIIFSTHQQLINETLTNIGKRFKIKTSELSMFLGMHIHIDEAHNIWLNQFKYIRTILKRFEMDKCRPISTPADSSIYDMLPAEGPPAIERPYRSIVGALVYLSISTRPDIAFITGFLSRFLDKYTEDHWNAALRVLKYLQDTSGLSIVYSGNPEPSLEDSLRLFCDADFAQCKISRRSVSGSVALLAGGPIFWASNTQKSVALSTTESEFYAITDCAKLGLWLRNLFAELRIQIQPVIHVDNKGALQIVADPQHHKRVKHIACRFLFVRETSERKQIDYRYIPTSQNVADQLTKPLPRPLFEQHRDSTGLTPWPVKQSFL